MDYRVLHVKKKLGEKIKKEDTFINHSKFKKKKRPKRKKN